MQALAQTASVRVAPAGAAAEKVSKAGCVSVKSHRAQFFSGAELKFNALSAKVPALNRKAGRRGVVVMKASTAARGYAAALLELAKGTGKLEAIHQDIESLSNLSSNKELSDFLKNPVVADDSKKSILKTLATDGKFNPQTVNFLNLLVDKRRIGLLQAIAVEFEELYCEETDTQVAVVTSAVKLENSQQALIAKKLQSMTKAKNIKLKNIVDAELIAGFIVKYGKDGSSEIDMSVRGQLDKLAAQFEFAQKAAPA